AVPAKARINAYDVFRNRNEADATRHDRPDADIKVDVRDSRDISVRGHHLADARALLLIDLDVGALAASNRSRAVGSIPGTLTTVRLTGGAFKPPLRLARGGTLGPTPVSLLARRRTRALPRAVAALARRSAAALRTLRFTSIRAALAGRDVPALWTLCAAGIRASRFRSAPLAHSGLAALRCAAPTGLSALSCAASL